MRKVKLLSLLLLFFIALQSNAQTSPEGRWQGGIKVMGTDLHIILNFSKDPNGELTGVIDIPSQNVSDMMLSEIIFDFPDINFSLDVPGAKATFSGELKYRIMEGNFEQKGIKGSFSVIKIEDEDIVETNGNVALRSYTEEEVVFYNGDLKFTGTLSLPLTDGKHPAVVLITGSGAHDRDENIGGFKIFAIIADHLTKNGIAVLRYDDRGVGGSDGSVMESTTIDFATDVESAVNYIRTRDEIVNTEIGLLGHSEGGIVAPIVAANNNEIAFIVLVAGTGVTGGDIILEQTKLMAKVEGTSNEEIERQLAKLEYMIGKVINDEEIENLDELLTEEALLVYEEFSVEQKAGITDSVQVLNMITENLKSMYNSPWFKAFVKYNPTEALENVKCDVLILFGGLDLQVPAYQNEKPMVDALKRGGNDKYKVITFDKANHLFQEAATGSPEEYAKLPFEFIDGFLDTITNWILQTVRQ